MRSARLIFAVVIAICLSEANGDEPKNVPINRLGSDFQLIGKLRAPLGKVVTVQGTVVEGPFKGYEGGFNLRIQSIDGKYTQQNIQIVIHTFFSDWGDKESAGGTPLPKLKIGSTYEMEGYETGGYVGVPDEAFERGAVLVQTTPHYFRTHFTVIKAKKIKPVSYAPEMFENEEVALLQGKAVSQDGMALMLGEGWRVIVMKDQPWPEHMEGKEIETLGKYVPESIEGVFKLVGGQARLIHLKDQIGQQVELRGKARSRNGKWWFHYRGTDLHVENMDKLPGWNANNHFMPMVIKGRLEKEKLPRPDRRELKSDRDLKEYFIVREARWKPLPALLSPERP